MANRNLSRVILLGGLSVNLNHLKIQFQSEKRSFQDQYIKYGKQFSEEADDTENGHFRKGRHSKSKDAVLRTPNYKQGRRPLE